MKCAIEEKKTKFCNERSKAALECLEYVITLIFELKSNSKFEWRINNVAKWRETREAGLIIER